jgi:hypothetical protein
MGPGEATQYRPGGASAATALWPGHAAASIAR